MRFPSFFRLVPLAATLALAACGGGDADNASAGGGGRGEPGGRPSEPPQVGFVTVQPTSVPQLVELNGRVAAFEMSEVRPQVTGLVRRRFFEEGALVRAGQTLYEIDPRLYRATAAEARANLASAQATAEAARIRATRLRPLAEIEAVAKQDFTDAVAAQRQAEAAIAQNRATLDTANVNLSFTRVPAPISGRIGRSLATVGALVTATQAEPMTVIQRLDPVFVDIQQSAAELLTLRRSLGQGGILPASAEVRLVLEDGSNYPLAGRVQFAEVMVNEATGTVTLRATFDNRQGLLLPGMFVRARFAQAINTGAYLVPQQAVTRTPNGVASIWVVGPDNIARERQVTTERVEGQNWVVTRGVRTGDRIVVQGVANLRPDTPVRPVPANTPQRIAPPGEGQGGGGGAEGGQAKGG